MMTIDQAALSQIASAYAAAWSSRTPDAVAAFFTANGTIAINGGELLTGLAAISGMAAGFFAEFPDLQVYCDDARGSGSHAIFVWTLEGHHVETRNHVKIGGWEEWDLDPEGKVMASRGWFDAAEYNRQISAPEAS
jgi:hypothetical protein